MKILQQAPSKNYFPTAYLKILEVDDGTRILIQEWRSSKGSEKPVIVVVPISQAKTEVHSGNES